MAPVCWICALSGAIAATAGERRTGGEYSAWQPRALLPERDGNFWRRDDV
jgi:hypothetical protein